MRLRFWLSHLTDQNLIASSKFYGRSTTSQRFLASVFPESFACQSFIKVKESKVVINLNKKIWFIAAVMTPEMMRQYASRDAHYQSSLYVRVHANNKKLSDGAWR